MATMTGTHMAPAHFHTTKLQMTRPVEFCETLFGFLELTGGLEMGGTAGTGLGGLGRWNLVLRCQKYN